MEVSLEVVGARYFEGDRGERVGGELQQARYLDIAYITRALGHHTDAGDWVGARLEVGRLLQHRGERAGTSYRRAGSGFVEKEHLVCAYDGVALARKEERVHGLVEQREQLPRGAIDGLGDDGRRERARIPHVELAQAAAAGTDCDQRVGIRASAGAAPGHAQIATQVRVASGAHTAAKSSESSSQAAFSA